MSDQQVKAINFKVQDVGKHVKGSKKRYQWTVSLKGKVHTISMDFSFISGKVKVVVDNRTLLENELPPNVSFQYPFTLDGFSLNCIQQGQSFQLRINNKVFTHLYNQEKTKVSFKSYEEEVKDISVNQAAFHNSSKTVKLSIGAFGEKKKNLNKAESDNWGSFGKNEGFPSFFGQQDSGNTLSSNITKKNKNLLDDDDQQTHQPPPKQQIQKGNQNVFQISHNEPQSILDFAVQSKQQVQNSNQSGFQYFDDVPQTSVSPNQELAQQHIQQMKKSPQDQFSNMQNMFATMNVGQSTQQKKNQPNPMDFFSMNISNNQPVNIEALKQNKIQIPQKSEKNQPNNTTQSFQFNTMQNLFSTNAINMSQQPQQHQQFGFQQKKNENQSQLDFNTMQIMFQTSANPNLFAQNQAQQSPQFTMAKKQEVLISQTRQDDFNTMGNLFNTSNNANSFNFQQNNLGTMQKKPVQQQPIFDLGQSQPTNQEFNNLQNFFHTISNPKGQTIPEPTQQQKIDPNSSEDIFKSMGLNLQNKPKVPMNTMGGGIDFNFQANKVNTFNTTQGVYGANFSKKNNQPNKIDDLL